MVTHGLVAITRTPNYVDLLGLSPGLLEKATEWTDAAIDAIADAGDVLLASGAEVGAGIESVVQTSVVGPVLAVLAVTTATAGGGEDEYLRKMNEEVLKQPNTAQTDKEKKAHERIAYKTYEQQGKPTKPLDENDCDSLSEHLKHSEEVLRMRRDFGIRWYNDGDHDPVNQGWQNRIDRLKKRMKELGCCP